MGLQRDRVVGGEEGGAVAVEELYPEWRRQIRELTGGVAGAEVVEEVEHLRHAHGDPMGVEAHGIRRQPVDQ